MKKTIVALALLAASNSVLAANDLLVKVELLKNKEPVGTYSAVVSNGATAHLQDLKEHEYSWVSHLDAKGKPVREKGSVKTGLVVDAQPRLASDGRYLVVADIDHTELEKMTHTKVGDFEAELPRTKSIRTRPSFFAENGKPFPVMSVESKDGQIDLVITVTKQ